MKLKKSIIFPFLVIKILSIGILIFNSDYFFYLSNGSAKFTSNYNVISGFIGNDSRFYYNMGDDLLSAIYSGLLDGGVKFGSILSLVGIYFYVNAAELFFGSKVIGVFLFNLVLFLLIMKTFQFKTHASSLGVILLFPLTLNYILVPNKEIFGFLLLAFLAAEKVPMRWPILLPLSITRDSYVAQILFHASTKYFDLRLMFLIFFIILPFAIPDSYFTDTSLVSGQRSGGITSIANYFLQIPVLSVIGVIIKIIIGLFSPIAISFDSLTIIKIQHFLCSIINFVFFGKFCLSRSFRRLILTSSPNYLRACLVYAVFMSLAPGNPARFLAPLSFMFLFKLICRK